jgi:3',5'-cyclic AMP phosphodiesterase CpdA
MLTVFHVSDLHFGRPTDPEQIAAIETIVQERRFDVVAISGDLSQRAHLRRVRRRAGVHPRRERVSKDIVIPATTTSCGGKPHSASVTRPTVRELSAIHLRRLEPVLRVPGATSWPQYCTGSHSPYAHVARAGHLDHRRAQRSQIDRAREEFEGSPARRGACHRDASQPR